MIVKN